MARSLLLSITFLLHKIKWFSVSSRVTAGRYRSDLSLSGSLQLNLVKIVFPSWQIFQFVQVLGTSAILYSSLFWGYFKLFKSSSKVIYKNIGLPLLIPSREGRLWRSRTQYRQENRESHRNQACLRSKWSMSPDESDQPSSIPPGLAIQHKLWLFRSDYLLTALHQISIQRYIFSFTYIYHMEL